MFKHPPELKPSGSDGRGSHGFRDGGDRLSGGRGADGRDGSSRGDRGHGDGNNNNRLDVLEATLSSVLVAVQKLTSFQANNLQTNGLNQWLSQKRD